MLQVEDLDFSSLLHCVVEVEDYNDHPPVFIPHFISLGPLSEDIAMGTSVARLAASDSDSGQNRDLTYSLLDESDPDGMFAIDQAGVVTVARPLDREASTQHHLIVIATDHGIPPLTGSATVQLSLLDVNDNGPEFEAVYTPVIYENVFGPQVGRTESCMDLMDGWMDYRAERFGDIIELRLYRQILRMRFSMRFLYSVLLTIQALGLCKVLTDATLEAVNI